MIKIELSKYTLEKHLNYCMGTEVGANKHRKSLYALLQNKIEHCTDENLKEILTFIYKNFERLVIGNPYELDDIKETISKKVNNIVMKEYLQEHQKRKEDEIKAVLESIFVAEYERFSNRNVLNNNLWWAYTFVQNLNISVCPYCNSQFIFTYLSKEGKTRPVLDHFFCKSKYPYLAISIYNLVPCCKVCNSDFKGSIECDLINYINPYIHEFEGKVLFKRSVTEERSQKGKKDYFSAIIGKSDDFNITLDYNNLAKELVPQYKKHAEVFHIEEIYEYHKNYVKDIINKSSIYNDIYTNQLKSSYIKLFQNDEDLRQVLIPREDQMNNIILSKLTRDIINMELKSE
ncbi:hypothetical protein [Bacillus mycoides]|uniref:hypothetical protein n=1 Tax=Bacillus mycoides TaxID=1405 RepID=UPI0037FFAF51